MAGSSGPGTRSTRTTCTTRSEEHTSELQSRPQLVCRLLLEKKKTLSATLSHTSRSSVKLATACSVSTDAATTKIYTLSLHDALPISLGAPHHDLPEAQGSGAAHRCVCGASRHGREWLGVPARGRGAPGPPVQLRVHAPGLHPRGAGLFRAGDGARAVGQAAGNHRQ